MGKTVFAICSLLTAILLSACVSDPYRGKETGWDSLYTAGHIQQIAFVRPDEALALLDTAEDRRLLSPFDINDLRCFVYHNGLSHYKTALFYARKAYALPESRKDPERFLSLVFTMAEDCHNNGDYAGSVKYCAEGLKLARETEARRNEADLYVVWGMNQLEMEQYDEAFHHIDLAIGILEEEARRNPCYKTWDGLFYALGMKVSLLWDKDRYAEALAMRPLIAKALRGLEASEDTPEGIFDMRRAETDVVYCCIAYTIGNKAEGDSLYRRVEQNAYSATPDGEYIRIPCLILAKRFDEALYYIGREKQILKETTDTVNWDYINPHLQTELEAYQGKGDWKAASRVQETMLALIDSLRKKERKEDALELAEIYKTDEQAHRIERQAASIQKRNMYIVCFIVILVVACLYIRHILKSNRTIRLKNDTMARTIDELMAYKDELFIRQEENIRLREELQRLDNAPDNPEPETAEGAEEADDVPSLPELTERDRALYDRVSYEIMSRRLYLCPGFNKKELLKEIHVPANKFAVLFKVFAGCSFSQYIQNCRLDYAVRLMREHPQWTLDAIAKEAQMSKGAFNIQFHKRYGMKPSEFRSRELSLDEEK